MVKNTNQLRSNRKKPSLKNDKEVLKDQQDLNYSIKHQTEVMSYSILPPCQMLKSIFCAFNCVTQSDHFK